MEILAIAPHPDDAELGCGGLLAKAATRGQSTGIIDLTQGELGSQGTPELRQQEATRAAAILGVSYRNNLSLPDGQINSSDETQLESLVKALRELRPRLVLAPYTEARHPDHAATSELVTKAVFFAALSKYKPQLGSRHQVGQLCYYALRRTFAASFVTDVSEVYQTKLQAIAAFSSQVVRDSQLTQASSPSDPGPLISSPLAVASIEARDSFYGAQIGVARGEAFAIRSPLAISDPLQFFSDNPLTGALLFDLPGR